MVSAPVATLGFMGAVVVVGLAVDRRVRSGAKLRSLPWWLQWTVGGLAISPLVFFERRLAVGPVDGLAVAFAVSAALWIGLPALLSRVAGGGAVEDGAAC